VRILIVEDEPAIADFVERGLRAEGYDVESVHDGIEAARRAVQERFDLMVLDLMLPGRDGLSVLEEVRAARPGLPVILLTARGEVSDRVAGLDAGASDYLVKPFAFAELAARVRARLRAADGTRTTLHAADVEIDLLGRTVSRAGHPVRLSTTEFDLLVHLVRHAGEVVTRPQLLSAVWGYDHDPGTNVVDVYVGYVRRKLRVEGREAPISTVRSVGYRFESRTE
jgi:DNA-binding response OmpR family regulator